MGKELHINNVSTVKFYSINIYLAGRQINLQQIEYLYLHPKTNSYDVTNERSSNLLIIIEKIVNHPD